jgi:hypothetical protein
MKIIEKVLKDEIIPVVIWWQEVNEESDILSIWKCAFEVEVF